MLIYVSFVLFLYIYSIRGFSLHQITEKLGNIEDRINAESKLRRDNFKTVLTEINSLKEMMQLSLETKMERNETDSVNNYEKENITKELEEKFFQLTISFKDVKMTNVRLKRKIKELYRQVSDLKIQTYKNADVLEKLLKGVELLTIKTEERKDYFNLFEGDISEIKMNIQTLTDTLEQAKKKDEHKFDKLFTYAENITDNIQHLKAKQKLCLEKSNISKKEEFITMDSKHENENITSEEQNVCNCSNSSFLEHSTASPEDPVVLHQSCRDIYDNGVKSNGLYQIDIGEEKPLSVYCDMETDDGGWTVFQRRQDGSVDFFRDWNAYKNGFGDLNGEFWLGNKYLNLLTDDDQQHELRIDLEDFEGNRVYAKYSSFKIRSEDTKYKLEVNGYTGNAGDSLDVVINNFRVHDKMKFSTNDDDNDKANHNCASFFNGGWWFNRCFASHLNGLYSQKANCEEKWKCIIWETWKGSSSSMKFTEIKLR